MRHLPDRPSLNRPVVEEPPQVVGQLGRGRVALLRVLLQTFQTDRLEVRRDLRLQRAHADRIAVPHLFQRVVNRASLERRTAGEKFVQDRAEGMDVRGRADVLGRPECLLGRHVGGRAHDAAVLGPAAVVVDALGKAEVGDLERRVGRAEGGLGDCPRTRRRPESWTVRGSAAAGSALSRTLPGLRSRWTIPREWA